MDKFTPTSSNTSLESRFQETWGRCAQQGTKTAPKNVWQDLVRRYSEPHRHYHTLRHLEHCLEAFDAARYVVQDKDAVEMAIWFHDIINDPDTLDNEERSTEFFAQLAEDVFSAEFVDKVGDLILATRHQSEPESSDARIISDIDLASLGAPWAEFIADGEALRNEQQECTDAGYYAAKAVFLSSLLNRRDIYYTTHFQSRLESRARENLRQYIASLERLGYRA